MKKYLILSLTFLCFTATACLRVASERMSIDITDSPVSAAIYACFNEKNPAVLQSLLSPQVTMHNSYGEDAAGEWEVLSDIALFFEEEPVADFDLTYRVLSVDKRTELIFGKYVASKKKSYSLTVRVADGLITRFGISVIPEHLPSACDYFNCRLL